MEVFWRIGSEIWDNIVLNWVTLTDLLSHLEFHFSHLHSGANHITSMVFFPQIHNFSLIMWGHQTNRCWGAFYFILFHLQNTPQKCPNHDKQVNVEKLSHIGGDRGARTVKYNSIEWNPRTGRHYLWENGWILDKVCNWMNSGLFMIIS